MVSRISIEEIQRALKYKDVRPARNWCERNGVLLISQGNQEYASEASFVAAYERPFIEKLKERYKENWKVAYELMKEGDILSLNSLENQSFENLINYKPKNPIEKKYHEKFNGYAKAKTSHK